MEEQSVQRESIFPKLAILFLLLPERGNYFPGLSFQDRGSIEEFLPVISVSLPLPNRTENRYDHGEHHKEPDDEEPPEQDIHHGASFPLLRP